MVSHRDAELLKSWQRSLHGKAPGTRKLYLRCMHWFHDWLTAAGLPADAEPGDLLAVGRRDAEGYFAAQEAAGMKPTTRRSRWIALRSFYGWLHEEEEITVNPMAKVKVERPDPPPITVLDAADLRALFAACEGKDFLDRRDLALLRLMVATGLRRAEVAALTVDDVDLDTRMVLVRSGKGDKARVGRFDAKTTAALDRYVRTRASHSHANRPNLWLTRLGALTHRGVQDIIDRRAAMAGLDHVHAHMLRHAWADRAKDAGLSDEAVMKLGGWSDSKVMQRYASARAVDRALAAYDSANVMGDL